jgi:hypothetical protein
MAQKGLGMFYIYDLSKMTKDIPELLSFSDITIDGAWLQPAPPEELRKVWINLTPYISKRRGPNDELVVSDVYALAQLLLRGALVASYHDSDFWLTPHLAPMVIQSYARACAGVISRMTAIDMNEHKVVETWFAAYYAQLMGGETLDLKYPPLLNRCQFLGSTADIKARLEQGEELRKQSGSDRLTLELVMAILTTTGSDRLKHVDLGMLRRSFAMQSSDATVMTMALEYPPYWVSQLYNTASGSRNFVIKSNLFDMGLKTPILKFLEELTLSPSFIGAIKR